MKSLNKILFLLFIHVSFSSVSMGQWVNDPTNTGSQRYNLDVHFLNPLVGFIAQNIGLDDGAIIKTIDGGYTWTEKFYATGIPFESLYFVDDNVGFAGGAEGTILRTVDGGENWEMLSGNLNFGVSDLHFFDSLEGFFCSLYMRYTDDGLATAPQPVSPIVSCWDMDWTNGGDAYAVGIDQISKSTDGGTTWFDQVPNTTKFLESVDFYDENFGICVGDSGVILRTTNGGNLWTPVSSGTLLDLEDVQIVTATIAFAVGHYVSWPNEPALLKSTDAGLTWSQMSNPAQWSLFGVHFPDPSIGFVVGWSDTFMRNENAISIEEFGLSHYTIAPNPFSDRCEISFSDPSVAGHELQLIDLSGRVVGQYTVPSSAQLIIERGYLAPGTYILASSSGQDLRTYVKLVIQ